MGAHELVECVDQVERRAGVTSASPSAGVVDMGFRWAGEQGPFEQVKEASL